MAYGKDDLFETLNSEGPSRSKYLKTFGIAAIIAVVVIGSVIYFTQTKKGDMVRAPEGLDDALKEYFLKSEKYEIRETKVHYCGESYGVVAWLLPVNHKPGPYDPEIIRHVYASKNADGAGDTAAAAWKVAPGVNPFIPGQNPCG